MADSSVTEDGPITFTVKSSNDAKYSLTLPLSTPVSELKEKLSSSEYADTPADRQRLIYSGRVLKDNETLATYNIKDGHTIHLVKSAASNQQRSNTSAQSSSTATPAAAPSQPAAGVPTNLAAGTGNNPLAGLTGARYAGFAQLPGAGMFGPDGGMGPPPDSETMLNMLENPQFQSTINEALQNPQMIDMMIQQNPMLRDMGPGVRQMMQSPEFRRMLTDPSSLRNMMQMQRAMGMGGDAGGASAFPAPGVTNTTPEGNQNTQQQAPPNPFAMGQMGLGNPFASLFGANPGANPFAPPAQPTATGTTGQTEATEGTQNPTDRSTTGEAQNPFAALLNPSLFGGLGQAQGQAGTGAGAGVNPFNPQQNPFLRDPNFMAQMMQAMGGQGGEGGVNPMASLFGAGGFGSPAPTDNRPPEDRYADQLRQLNDMGFFEFERNIEALRRAGGSVQGAVEYLLSNPS
ncbi:ubiquitin-like protein DskB [Penicillium lividum]|nr:ubiquitin-like protein DskB [Penicillium lividum]